MKAQRLSVSFEVVARCLSHHGQLPEAEYLVTTAITRLCPDGQIEVLFKCWTPHNASNLILSTGAQSSQDLHEYLPWGKMK
jgi:hypothetical protein